MCERSRVLSLDIRWGIRCGLGHHTAFHHLLLLTPMSCRYFGPRPMLLLGTVTPSCASTVEVYKLRPCLLLALKSLWSLSVTQRISLDFLKELLRATLLLLSCPVPDSLGLTPAIADGVCKGIANEFSMFSITFIHESHKNTHFHSIFLAANSGFCFSEIKLKDLEEYLCFYFIICFQCR